jgi:hypothetical protein
MIRLVFLLEEPSARDLLEGLLPRLISPDIVVHYMVFEGKQDLEKRMIGRMKAWRLPDTFFVVLRDQDAGDCRIVKARLQERADEAGRPDALIRIACRALESWFLGDWSAIAKAFDSPIHARQDRKAKFANPDLLSNPVHELRHLIPDYQKRDGARRIGVLLDPACNRSRSLQVFCAGIQAVVRGPS